MDTLANIADGDDMQHNARFHLGLHCLLIQNRSSEKEIHYFLGNYNLWPLKIYNGPSDLSVSNFLGNSIGTIRFV